MKTQELNLQHATQRFWTYYRTNSVATLLDACRQILIDLELPDTPANRNQLVKLMRSLAEQDDPSFKYDDIVAQSFPASDPPPPPVAWARDQPSV